MYGRQSLCWLLTMLLLVASGPTLGCPGALLIAPTTDITPTGHYSMEIQGDSTTPVRPDTSKEFFNTQFGLAKNFDAGVDFDLSRDAGGKAITNAKYRVDFGGKAKLAAAFGVQGVDGRFKSIPFVTTSAPFSFARLTAGVLRSDEKTRLFGGFDKQIGDRLTVMADYISGREWFTSAGADYALTQNLSVLGYAEFPNNGGDVVYSMHLVVCGSFF